MVAMIYMYTMKYFTIVGLLIFKNLLCNCSAQFKCLFDPVVFIPSVDHKGGDMSLGTCQGLIATRMDPDETGSMLVANAIEHHELLDKRLLYYEPVHYNQDDLHHQHQQVGTSGDFLRVKFQAFNRNFSLELKRVPSTSNIILHHKRKSTKPDLSFVYTGKDTDYSGSEARVAVINGTFQGKIKHPGETTYHIVPSSWLFKQLPPFHTVIYSQKDYKWNHTFPSDTVHNVDKQSQMSKKPKGRTKRELPPPPTSSDHHVCSLKLTTDTTVWKYYMNLNQNEDRSHYDILFLLESHVAEANKVFRNEKFTLKRGPDNEKEQKQIQFEIRAIEIMTDLDCDKSVKKKSELCKENLDGHSVLTKFADQEEFANYDYLNYEEPTYGDHHEKTDGENHDTSPDGDYHDKTPDGDHYDKAPGGANYDKTSQTYYDYDYEYSEAMLNDTYEEKEKYCLSFLITARVLYHSKGNPLLGLTYRAEKGKQGGVCSQTANNGFVTLFQETNQALPALVTELVFTHEIAHAFGAIHDNMKECSAFKLNQEPADGYYLMHAVAQRGDKPNHQKLSGCSLKYISETLAEQENSECFTGSELPYCGNGIVDAGEECDCGSDCDIDHCCHSHTASGGLKCKLKAGAQCSPSQGPCCNSSVCRYIHQSENFVCQNARPCTDQLYCHGEVYGAQCPPPSPDEIRADGFICSPNGRVCDAGSCNASICKLIQWRECQMSSSKQKLTIHEKESLCYIGCQRRKSTECVNTSDLDNVRKHPELLGLLSNISVGSALLPIQLPVGTPCNKNTGYCDVFKRCRGADPDTPLVRLKDCFGSGECADYIVFILRVYWWAVLLGSIAGIVLFWLFVKCFAVHTKSSNPIMEERHPHRSVRQSVSGVYETVSHPRRSFRASVRSVRSSFRRMNSRPLSFDLKRIEAELEILNENPKTNVDDVFL